MSTPAADVLKPDFAASRRHFIFTEEHDRLRESIRAFVTKELAPHADEWEETTFPDSVFARMGELGLLGLSYPEEYGGQGGDYSCNLVLAEEMTHSNCGGLAMGVAVHTDMATPPIHVFGTEEQKQRYLVPAIAGTKISCLGITEPDAGSDVAGIRTRAVRDGDEWVINGAKTYITNGHRADFIVLVTQDRPRRRARRHQPVHRRHGPARAWCARSGSRSSACTPPTPRCSRSRTSACPRARCSGEEGKGFYHIMWELQGERLIGAAGCVAAAQKAFDKTLALRDRAAGVRAPDRPLPGHPAQVRRDGDGDRGRAAARLHDGLALRERRVPRARDLDGQGLRGADGVRGDRRVPADPRRRRLHEGVRDRARRGATCGSTGSAPAPTRSCST